MAGNLLGGLYTRQALQRAHPSRSPLPESVVMDKKPIMNAADSKQKGYTLIEIVMVIVLLGIIGLVTFQVVFSGVETFAKARDRKELYDQARMAMERMTREVRDTDQVLFPAVGSTDTSIQFQKPHPATDGSGTIRFWRDGATDELKRDRSGPATEVLASNITSFQATHEGSVPAGPTISFDNSDSNWADNSATVTIANFAIGGGNNRLLVVGVSLEDSNTGSPVTGVTFNGQPLTYFDFQEVQGPAPSNYIARVELWYMLEANLPVAGSYNIVVSTAPVTPRGIAAGAMALEDVAQQAPEASNKNTSFINPIQTTVNTVTDGAWLVDVVACGNVGTYTADPGQINRWDAASFTHRGAGSTEIVPIAGAATVGWTHSGANRQAHLAAAFAPATGNPVTTGVILDVTASSASGGTVHLRSKIYPRNLP